MSRISKNAPINRTAGYAKNGARAKSTVPFTLQKRGLTFRSGVANSSWHEKFSVGFRERIAAKLDPKCHLHLQTEVLGEKLHLFVFLPPRAGDVLNETGQFCVFHHPFRVDIFDPALDAKRMENLSAFFINQIGPQLGDLSEGGFATCYAIFRHLYPNPEPAPEYWQASSPEPGDWVLGGYYMGFLFTKAHCTDADVNDLNRRLAYYRHWHSLL